MALATIVNSCEVRFPADMKSNHARLLLTAISDATQYQLSLEEKHVLHHDPRSETPETIAGAYAPLTDALDISGKFRHNETDLPFVLIKPEGDNPSWYFAGISFATEPNYTARQQMIDRIRTVAEDYLRKWSNGSLTK